MSASLRRWWFAAAGVTVIVIAFALELVFSWDGARPTVWIDDIGEGVAAAAGGVACLVAAIRSSGRTRAAWAWMASSALVWAAGEAVWCWYELIRAISVPFPSPADIGFLAAVPTAVIGMILLSPGAGGGFWSVRTVLDGLIITGSLLFVSWVTALGVVYRSGGDLFARVISLAYPAGDVIVATVVLTALAGASSARRRQLVILGAALLALAVSDSMFAYLTTSGTYGNGNWLDSGWVAGYLLIGLAALRPVGSDARRAGNTHQLTTAQVLLPYVPFSIAVATMIVRAVLGGSFDVPMISFAAATTGLVIIRQLFTIVENQRLNRRLEHTVDQLRNREGQLAHQAFHDALTGLANRVLFADRVDHALRRQERTRKPLAVLICDLDEFKAVNDSLGHPSGDELLRLVADRLTLCVRQGDTVSRLGGDEFAVLLEDIDNQTTAFTTSHRILDALKHPVYVAGREIAVRVSIGITMADAESGRRRSDELLRDADVALYAAKRAGRNRYVLFEERMLDDVMFRSELVNDLRGLVADSNQMLLHYQPIVEVRTGAVTGVEALLRWSHPTRGLLKPSEFIGYAEETGSIVALGSAALSEACLQLSEWHRRGIPCPMMAVNLSVRQVRDRGLVEAVDASLRAASLSPENLILEITESMTLESDELAVERIHQLRDIGVQLAIDDFGTGYSSLEHLRWLPVDYVKIDRVFTSGITTDRRSAVLVDAIAKLAHSLGLEAIVEGIETADQMHAARAMGCDHAQGYYIAMPSSPVAVTRILTSQLHPAGSARSSVASAGQPLAPIQIPSTVSASSS